MEAAVQEAGRMLRADGGDLLVVNADPGAARIHLRVVLDDVRCDDCVLPPQQLRAVIDTQLQQQLLEEFELIIDDPRAD
ncbi:MAG: hypothetical protein ACOYNI_02375 [Acidimicrobiia bacterium]